MSRSPNNNPTERIARILDDVDELQWAFEQWANAAAAHLPPDVLQSLPAMPRLVAVELEKQRQSLTPRRRRIGKHRVPLESLRPKRDYETSEGMRKAQELYRLRGEESREKLGQTSEAERRAIMAQMPSPEEIAEKLARYKLEENKPHKGPLPGDPVTSEDIDQIVEDL